MTGIITSEDYTPNQQVVMPYAITPPRIGELIEIEHVHNRKRMIGKVISINQDKRTYLCEIMARTK